MNYLEVSGVVRLAPLREPLPEQPPVSTKDGWILKGESYYAGGGYRPINEELDEEYPECGYVLDKENRWRSHG
jgi:hypothetical protein